MFPVEDSSNGRKKYSGIARAKVISNQDPQLKGRIRVDHPLLGQTPWIPYLQLPFMFDVPGPGDIVYVQCDGGFEEHPIAWGKVVAPSSFTQVPGTFRRSDPNNRGVYTPGGHIMEFDDGDTSIKLTASSGQLIHMGASIGIFASSATNVTLSMASGVGEFQAVGTSIKISATGLNFKDAPGNLLTTGAFGFVFNEVNGNTFLMNPAGIFLIDKNGNQTVMDSSGIKCTTSAGSKMTLSASEASILDSAGAGMKASGGVVALGGSAAEVLDVLSTTLQELQTATYPGFGAPAANAGAYAPLKAKIDSIKGSL